MKHAPVTAKKIRCQVTLLRDYAKDRKFSKSERLQLLDVIHEELVKNIAVIYEHYVAMVMTETK